MFGYAFVNFVDELKALRARQIFEGWHGCEDGSVSPSLAVCGFAKVKKDKQHLDKSIEPMRRSQGKQLSMRWTWDIPVPSAAIYCRRLHRMGSWDWQGLWGLLERYASGAADVPTTFQSIRMLIYFATWFDMLCLYLYVSLMYHAYVRISNTCIISMYVIYKMHIQSYTCVSLRIQFTVYISRII